MAASVNDDHGRLTDFSEVVVFYFSGTGNSRNVAKWLQEVSVSKGIPCNLFSIEKADVFQTPVFPPEATIVLVSPIHGFNYPHIMLKFISRMPQARNRVILMNTRAGMVIRKWVTPGLTGIAFYFTTLLLTIKGYRVAGMLPVDMPSNWVSLHPGLNDRTVRYIHERMKEKITIYWQQVIAGRKGITNFPALKEVIQDLLISPVAILYYFIGRFFIAKTFYATDKCDHCGICIRNCPVEAISEKEGRPYWKLTCESCMKCMGNCPKSAIETAHGLVLTLAVIFNLLLLFPLKSLFAFLHFHLGGILTEWIAEPILLLSLTFLSYRRFHFLLRFQWFQRIAKMTSLTTYRFWGKKYRALRNM